MCIFCDIVAGKIPADKVAETESVLAFRDINPNAPVHVLVIPKKHIRSLHDFVLEDGDLATQMFAVIQEVAEKEGVARSGYRVVTNIGDDGGQEVPHLHWHVLGGKRLKWEY